MASKSKTAPAPLKKTAMAAWVACGGVIVVLSFLFGTMVGDGGAASPDAAPAPASQTSSPAQDAVDRMSGLPAGARQISPDEVPPHLLENARPPGSGTRAPVIATPQVVDLGTVVRNQATPASVQLQNTGTDPLTIRSTRANCGCTTVDMAGTVIPPGRSVPLQASFKSSDVGQRSSTITVLFEGYDEPLQVSLSAMVEG